MKEGARHEAPAAITASPRETEPVVPRHVVVAAWEALGEGDYYLAGEILLNVLEQDGECAA